MITTPKVTIGLPVYNGTRYLRLALDSLLAQNYPNFDLLISDNASTDDSADIGLEYAKKDPRIRFYRNDTNIGAARNFNRLFQLSSSPYFMWAAHDDLWHPEYLSRCVETLEQNPKLVLCGSRITFIGESGEPVWFRDYVDEINWLDSHGLPLQRRIATLTEKLNWYACYGVIRSTALLKTRLFRETFGGDVILLLELLLIGESQILSDQLFSYRFIRKTSHQQIHEIVGPNLSVVNVKPYTGLVHELLGVIHKSECDEVLKAAMRNDLLDNVCDRNASWKRQLLEENPSLNQWPGFHSLAELRAIFQPSVSEREIKRLRREAHNRYLSSLPIKDRVKFKIRRFFDHYVLWRFRSS